MSDGPDEQEPARRLDLDVDLVPDQTGDDTDEGWGTAPRAEDPAATLRRYLDEKPPHHGD